MMGDLATFPRSAEEIADDYATRRAGMLRALTDGEHAAGSCSWTWHTLLLLLQAAHCEHMHLQR